MSAIGLDINNGVDLTQQDMLQVILSWIKMGIVQCVARPSCCDVSPVQFPCPALSGSDACLGVARAPLRHV